jgi:opacity protein-like surface antigen
MNKLILSFAFILVCGLSQAQGLRFNTYGGYVFPDRFDSFFSSNSYFEGRVEDGFRWGAGLEYLIPGGKAIEIQYLRQDTNAPTTWADSQLTGGDVRFTNFDLGINWIMFNFTNYFPVSEVAEPFIGGGLGMGIFSIRNPDTGGSQTPTKFGWNIRGGTNLWVSENVGIRIQASLFSAVQSVGGGLWLGTGGAGAGLTTFSTMYQFGFDGGLVFKIPR